MMLYKPFSLKRKQNMYDFWRPAKSGRRAERGFGQQWKKKLTRKL